MFHSSKAMFLDSGDLKHVNQVKTQYRNFGSITLPSGNRKKKLKIRVFIFVRYVKDIKILQNKNRGEITVILTHFLFRNALERYNLQCIF